MSTFVIFIIMLTLGYIIYYAAMIAIDLNAKSKSDASKEETIAADIMDEDEDDFLPLSVIENPHAGGFRFLVPEHSHTGIQEDIKETEDMEQSHEAGAQPIESVQDEERDSSASVDDSGESRQAEKPNQDVMEESDSSNGTASDKADESSYADNISMVNYEEEIPVVKQENNEPFDENEVFDNSLLTPPYEVKEMIVPKMSAEVICHANETNDALASIQVNDYAMDSRTFSQVMHAGNANKYGIESIDDVQNY